jgi:hypothetical protein
MNSTAHSAKKAQTTRPLNAFAFRKLKSINGQRNWPPLENFGWEHLC